ncbi:MAG: hypothetical protein WDK96_02220 [Candidatus Paceibacterota bacterium]|jgi:hypothetical protein
MKTKILFLAGAFISIIFLSSCGSSSPEKKVETVNTEVKMAVDTTTSTVVNTISSSEDKQVVFYHPNLNLLFSNAKTKEQKKQVWLKVKDGGEKNWLMIKDVYEKKWLATKDSAQKVWLKIKDQSFNIFKKEDPDAYQQYVALENSGNGKALILFEQTTTSTAYKKYDKTQLDAYINYDDIQLRAYINYDDIQLRAFKIYDDAK